VITSTRHPLVRTFRDVAASGRRDPEHRILLEGPRLIADALDAGVAVETALVANGAPGESGRSAAVDAVAGRLRTAGTRVQEASSRVVEAAGDVTTSQGIVALARRPDLQDLSCLQTRDLVLLVADGIADPGNLGTMIRTAVAAGATAVAITERGADPFLPKTVRATMGAVFRIPLIDAPVSTLRQALTDRGATVFVADPLADVDYTHSPLAPPLAIVVGSEAGGPDARWREGGRMIRIPLLGPVESLNASIAAGVLLYECVRQRMPRQGGLGP
jgi:TrmH family RNA methyltransferase